MTNSSGGINSRLLAALPVVAPPSPPRRYRHGLTPSPSPLRPHCLARDRLHLWRPASSRAPLDHNGIPLPFSAADIQRIGDVLIHAWSSSTTETYGTGLLLFHVFCDAAGVPEDQRAPTSQMLLASFIASLAGSYAGQTLSNYVFGIRAWHILHGLAWSVNHDEVDALLRAASAVAPASSKRKKRLPYTPDLIITLRSHLTLADPLDAAIFACLTTCFYSAARVGEFTVRNLQSFDAAVHVRVCDVRVELDCKGLSETVFFLPRTKMAPSGEDVCWAMQNGLSDPHSAFQNHIAVNAPPTDGPLFAYRHQKGHRPLTKSAFLQRLAKAARATKIDPLQGHGIRIGATLEYLLRGITFDVVKVKGRWAGDSFVLYLRKHAQILAPYMQAVPAVQEQFLRYTMPPVR
ncbi:hypothetical protein GLOTRDRAFT_51059 [Gloeophyllum trabeum ATCC 11539]|uniref:DNA breaking-rejoining enzyme n=1 Tax=Gloeophyllum trabeum (strain ATCC 11539 / FP-39264 / Madison 617) TaxID=670483 RepID=S7R6R6_GLOTA|nr:uncharacterized protein GLOTRDRAFT_51059 [Gloeophyllum trabeum ATCC 11539]EPQ50080.1 hypothetical protein GLOTRDRAFT_51059 [Gloeophyllum trabeum ATCC 11539]